MGQIATTATPLANGATAITGVGKVYRLAFAGTWLTDEHLTLTPTQTLTVKSELIGFGPLTGQEPNFLKTFKRKLYLVAGTSVFFCAIDSPTVFNALNKAGNSFMELANEYGFADDLLAIAIFRKRLAFLGRQHIEIWAVDPDPALNFSDDTLENEGTVNGASVRGIGKGDVLYCADSGVRSLGKRQATDDATVEDLGTPVDALVQASLDSTGSTGICSIVEPRTRRYWLAIGTTIYVFSYFASSGVIAWSTYEASYEITGNAPTSAANYNASGRTTFSGLIIGNSYTWTKGANDAALQYTDSAGVTQQIIVSGSFVTGATTANGIGTVINIAITATLAGTYKATFTPEKFVVFNGQIYVRSTSGIIFRYGGSDNATYDSSVCSWETPWLDANKPGTEKPTRGMDAGVDGHWIIKAGTATESANPLKQILDTTGSTFRKGVIPMSMGGTHLKVRGESRGPLYARVGLLTLGFEIGNQR